MLDKFDVYLISDPMFRVHARLFKVQEAILRSSRQQVLASKRIVLARAGAFTSMVLFLLSLLVQVFDLKWGSTPVLLLMLVGVVVILVHTVDYAGLKKDERRFESLMGDEEGLAPERWVDYAEALMAAYGSRLKMLARAEKELEEQRKTAQIDDTEYQERSSYYALVRQYSMQRIEYYSRKNEELYKAGKRTPQDYEEVLMFVRAAEIGLPRQEVTRKDT
jgi:hypothetical protein